MKKVVLTLALFNCILVTAFSQKSNTLFIGTYTAGKSVGIYTYTFENANAATTLVQTTTTSNPSYLVVSPNKKYLYAVNENADSTNTGGLVSSYAIHKRKKQLTLINQQPTMGNHPCYVEIDKKGNYVFVGNYNGGNLSVLKVEKKGALSAPIQTIQHIGKSSNKQRQEKAHVHATVISADNKYLLVPDLGMDKVMQYSFDENSGALIPTVDYFTKTQAGSGPRHLVFHPNQQYAYLAQELSGSVSVYTYKDGNLKLKQTISTVPEKFSGNFSVADIHTSKDGKFLYVSNRADAESIAMYSIDATTGILTNIGFQPCLGTKPRNFVLSPNDAYLLVANQNSDEVVIFSRDIQTGLLTDTGKRIAVPNPVCLKWLED
jgi:6-phosphogluconolactonase